MQIKASLHIHSKEDRRDGHIIDYSIYELIDEAERCGFNCLGFTPHEKFVFKPEFAAYALAKGILLIPGIELSFGRLAHKHVIVLNCDRSAEQIRNFKQLRAYKAAHPECFILAPHPTHNRLISMGARALESNIDLFDAVEHAWLYSKHRNSNLRSGLIAQANGKPVISTADVHSLCRLDTDFAMIEAESLTADSVLSAIKRGSFANVTCTKPYRLVFNYLAAFVARHLYRFLTVKVLGLERRVASERIRVLAD